MTNTPESLPHWNLDSIYPGMESEPYRQAAQELASRVDELDQLLQTHGIAAGLQTDDLSDVTTAITEYLEAMSVAMRVNTTLRLYIWCILDTDSSNDLAARNLSELDSFNLRLKQQTTQFQTWLGANRAMLPDVLAQSESARAHSLYLSEIAEQSRYLMSAPEESLATELSLSSLDAWSKLHGTLWSQLEVLFERDGKTDSAPLTMIQNLALFDPDPAIRQRAGEAEVAAWASMREPLTAALNSIAWTKITLAKRRGRQDILHASLDQARINRLILDTMLASVREALPALRAYFNTKARLLKKETLAWWDLFAPIGQMQQQFTFQEAQHFIIARFDSFSPRLGNFARHAFDHGWIDAEPRAGKQGGAYCNCAPGTGISRILCNFDGSLQQVFTIAHELGHAFHFDCQTGKTYQQWQTPMTLAESASLFCETLITEQALAMVQNEQDELSILNTFLSTAMLNIVGTLSSFDFEQEVYKRREIVELSADDLCDLSQQFDREVFGAVLNPEQVHPYQWAAYPHNFMPNISFYNFPYAFGMLFGLGLYARYQERGVVFIPEFEALLASTGEVMPAELASRFGIDLSAPGFWQNSLRLIEKRIVRYQELCAALR